MKVLWHYWWKSFAVAFFLTSFFAWWHGGFSDGFLINRSFADAGLIMIGLSYALSGVSYFCKVNQLAHRKYLGLVGFALIIVHTIMSFLLFTIRHFFEPLAIVPFLFALVSTLFFTWLAVISTDYWMRKLKQDWRKWLRAGYIAFVFGIIHVIILYWRSWNYWFTQPQGMIAPSFVVSFFGALVILLRVALWLRIKK